MPLAGTDRLQLFLSFYHSEYTGGCKACSACIRTAGPQTAHHRRCLSLVDQIKSDLCVCECVCIRRLLTCLCSAAVLQAEGILLN